ncbi:porin [Paraburkholderia sp. BL23I1N1]|uniref:porin n=1 Tax=Paraburkholderia sp. BL23I1N1 TaxID=1938802 RepID=UPI000E7269D3|nr:porin [Paraburkholderia sp. BL23I1N1]
MCEADARARKIRCALTLLLATGGVAHAQSSVTLYGIIDSGIEYVNNVGVARTSVWRMPSLSGNYPSRWGLTGTEDLGGGNRTIFTLESGFSPSQCTLNQGGRLFGRQAFVGISGDWGSLSFGRQYTMSYLVFAGSDVMGPNAYTWAAVDPYLANARVDNSIVYRVRYKGLDFGATYSFGRDSAAAPAGSNCGGRSPDDANACRDYSAMLKYDAGWGGVSTSYERIYGGPGAAARLTSSKLHDSRATLNAYVKIGQATIGGGFVRRINDGNPTERQSDAVYAGVSYWFTPALIFVVQGGQLTYKETDNTSRVVALRLSYLLSKQTSVYVTGGHVWNQGQAAVAVSGTNATGADPAPGQGQSGFLFGIRHNF